MLEKDNVYESTSKILNYQLNETSSVPIVKEQLPSEDLKGKGFILRNVLSKKECDDIIQEAISLELEDIDVNPSYRNNKRVSAKSEELAEMIWKRITPFIDDSFEIPVSLQQKKEVGVHPGFKIDGKWNKFGLNEVFRICKYEPNGHFGPHMDGNFIRNMNERSLLTFMIYLNGDFEGGNTNFLSEKQTLFRDEITLQFRGEDKNILCAVKPEAGLALIFNHMLLHEGGQLLSGEKWIMRSDIMFNRDGINRSDIDPKENEALLCYAMAERLESDQDKKMEAMMLYRKAFKLCSQLADAYQS